MTYKNKGIFVLFTHIYRPTLDGKVQVQEQCEMVDRIKSRHQSESTIIIDFLHKKIIKDRTGRATYASCEKHFRDTYPNEFKQLMVIVEQALDTVNEHTTDDTEENTD
jgi:hypothetical protein